MPSCARVLLEDVFYHIMSRGNQKQKVFREKVDFDVYLKRIKLYKRRYKFRLYGFCLMPNHVHIMGRIEKKEDLSKFMHGITRSYTAYFHNKYKTVGHLWQGRFKSMIIVEDEYAINCMDYIEMNPVRANLVTKPDEYKWSSYKERNFGPTTDGQILDALSL